VTFAIQDPTQSGSPIVTADITMVAGQVTPVSLAWELAPATAGAHAVFVAMQTTAGTATVFQRVLSIDEIAP
jgi:hypothetical protein